MNANDLPLILVARWSRAYAAPATSFKSRYRRCLGIRLGVLVQPLKTLRRADREPEDAIGCEPFAANCAVCWPRGGANRVIETFDGERALAPGLDGVQTTTPSTTEKVISNIPLPTSKSISKGLKEGRQKHSKR
jgi:hypothetical protein